MDRLTQKHRRKNIQAIKSKGSKIETMLAKQLWKRSHRYRKNDKSVFSKPDLTFKGLKIAVFCDSEFWHGKDCKIKKQEHKTNIEFWHQKIERNIERDKEVNEMLFKSGWKVLRFWGKEIEQDLVSCISKIEAAINEVKGKNNN